VTRLRRSRRLRWIHKAATTGLQVPFGGAEPLIHMKIGTLRFLLLFLCSSTFFSYCAKRNLGSIGLGWRPNVRISTSESIKPAIITALHARYAIPRPTPRPSSRHATQNRVQGWSDDPFIRCRRRPSTYTLTHRESILAQGTQCWPRWFRRGLRGEEKGKHKWEPTDSSRSETHQTGRPPNLSE
jgi:hypothetical protein